MRSFWFHYNKPASKKAGYPKVTLHYNGQCLVLDNIECNAKIKTKVRKRQPFFVVAGYASKVEVKNSIAFID